MQMQINIESPHLKISDELQNKVQAQCLHLQRIYSRITGCEVVFRTAKNDQHKNCEIEARLLIPKSSFFARARAETFETALQDISENLFLQLKREKERRQETW